MTITTENVATSTKRCSTCGEVKARDMFYKASGSKDGLLYQCKQCARTYQRFMYASRAYSNRPHLKRERREQSKLCVRCQKLRALSEYALDVTSEDGRQDVCADCNALYARCSDYEPEAVKELEGKVGLIGKYSKEQVVSIIREMAALQHSINAARSEYKERITEEQQRVNALVSKAVRRQIVLERLLRAMCVKSSSDGLFDIPPCDYVHVEYADGRLRVALNPDVAWA